MYKALRHLILKVFLWLKPVFGRILLGNPDRLTRYRAEVKNQTRSGMVVRFNFLHRLIFRPFFKRVNYLPGDISKVKHISGSTVFIMKNRGQLEYRYFNELFLKEKLAPVSYANKCITIFWLPLKKMWQLFVCWLDKFYSSPQIKDFDEKAHLEGMFAKDKNVLLNLTISRDYFFGLIRTNPLQSLSTLVDIQHKIEKPVHVVTMQFLYDQHPDKSEKTYFDLLFGPKSQPGALRKILLFIMNYRRHPRVKFGEPLNLKDFLNRRQEQDNTVQCKELFGQIEEDLRIEQARITGPRLRSKEAVVKEIVGHSDFKESIEALALNEKKDPKRAIKTAQQYLEEIVADVSYSYVHFAHVTLGYVWNNIFDGFVLKHDQLNKIREVAGKNPVVLVPMHRSHIDSLLITDLFYMHNITFPHICAGINLNFWPLGRLLRKCGGFFIRRSFEGNKIYKETLYHYLKSLVRHGHCLEFFIEGTRSRTGKLLKPKMGILSMIMRAFFEGGCDDIYFVPIAVSYDHLLEQKEYQKEGSGKEKSKENAGELFKARKVLKKKYGKVYIEFADPISLKKFCADKNIEAKPIDQMKKEVGSFAYHLTYYMNRVALVTPTSLVALAILSLNHKTFDVKSLLTRVKLFKDYLDFKDVEYSDLINYSDQYAYNEAIKKLCQQNILKEVETFEESFYMFEGKHREDLDYYKNNILHFFVSLVCLLKVMNSVENYQALKIDAALKQYELIKKLFQQDFTFSERNPLRDHLMRVIDYCSQKGYVRYDATNEQVTKTLTQDNFDEFSAFQGLLDNFLESHLISLRFIKHTRIKKQDKKALIKEILVKAKPMYLKGDLSHPEALSQFNLENSFKTFRDLGILTEEKADRRLFYSSTQEVELIDQWIQSVDQLLKILPPLGDRNASQGESAVSEEQEGLH